MSTNTIRLHRVLRATPAKIYRAFLDADAMAKWLPPNGFTGKVHQMDVKVGGTYKMSFTNFTTGKSHSFGGTYVELTPQERIRYTDKFDDPNLPGEMQPIMMFKCHCRDCQQVTGSGFAPGLLLSREAFRLTRGQLRYNLTPSIRRGKHKRGFCPECGSRITGGEFEGEESPFVGILAGSL